MKDMKRNHYSTDKSRASSPYLVADVGGTNARFALAQGSGETGFSLSHVQRVRNQDFEDLRDAALAFLEGCCGARPRRACFAIAAPITPGKVRLTNATWKLDPVSLADDLGLERLIAVNDFAAQARGAPLCPPDLVAVLNEGKGVPDAPLAVLGPGTGLGLGLLAPRPGGGYSVIATEGGHAGFAPRTPEEIAVYEFIAREHGFVSWERILSGRGLVNIHRALCAIEGRTWPGTRAEEITALALADEASLEGRVVMLFCACLGAYAGDVSIIAGARGGTWLAGGILPRIRPLLEASAFEAHRVRHGPMTSYVEEIPVRMILSDAVALLGAAALAESE